MAEAVELEGPMQVILRLRQSGVKEPRLLEALERVPRLRFVPLAHQADAFGERPVPLECGQVLHPVSLTARLVDALDVRPQHSVLDLGTGSGYQAALLGRLARKVHSVERFRGLLEQARRRLSEIEAKNVILHHGDGRTGLNGHGLFDRVVADSAFDGPPRALLDHLVSGGFVVCPVGPPGEVQTVTRFEKVGSRFERQDLFQVRVGTFLPGTATAL